MKRTVYALAIIVAALASAIPLFAMATFTFNTIGAIISMPQQRLIGWTLAFVVWWVGFGAALVFARRLSRSQKPWLELRVIVPLIAGLIAIALLEVQSWHARQHGLMLGFFAIPFVLPIAAGWLIRMLSNRPVNPDARDLPPSAEGSNARAGYRERWTSQEMTRVLAFLVFAAGSMANPLDALGDTPLTPPGPSTVCSPNGKVCIEMKPDSDGLVYRKGPRGERIDLWVMPSWNRAVFLSDDGRHLVKCYGGLNLVPRDYDPDMSLVEVWREGTLIYRLSLRAVVGNLSAMPRTVSHYAWGSCLRFESETRFVIALEGYTRDGDLIWKRAVLDVMSGQLRRTNQRVRM